MGKKKIVWITGGTKGLGLHLVRLFAAQEYSVLASYSSDDAAMVRAQSEMKQQGKKVTFMKADCSDEAAVRKCTDWLQQTYGRLDVLVNNAGIGFCGGIEETEAEQFAHLVNINLTGKYNCIKAALPLLKQSENGTVVNVSSASGENASAGMSAYCSAAAGIIMMTRCLAKELAVWHIRVNCVSPSMLDGGMSVSCFSEEDRRYMAASNPLGRLGSVEDVGACILWLCSDAAAYINGENILITGGR